MRPLIIDDNARPDPVMARLRLVASLIQQILPELRNAKISRYRQRKLNLLMLELLVPLERIFFEQETEPCLYPLATMKTNPKKPSKSKSI